MLESDFARGGWVMAPIALLGFLGASGAIVGVIRGVRSAGRRTLALASTMIAFGLLAPGLGLLAYLWGRLRTEGALTHVTGEQLERLRAAGLSEALTGLIYGLGAGAIPLCAGVALVGLGVVRLRPAGTGI